MIPTITAVRLTGSAARNELPLLVLGPPEGVSAVAWWGDCAPLLADDFDLLAWDHPGQGYNTGVPAGSFTPAELAAGVLAVVDDVLVERGELGQSSTAFAYVGVGLGKVVGDQLTVQAPDRIWARVAMPDELSPRDHRVEFADLIVEQILGRPAPVRTVPEPGTRRRTDDLEAGQYHALRDLTDALADLALAGATTALSTQTIRDHIRTVRALADGLRATDTGGDGWPHPINRITRSRYETPQRMVEQGMEVRINDLNPMHPGLDVRIDPTHAFAGRSAVAEVTLDALQEGPPDTAHGGTIAFLMDSMLGILVQSSGVPAVTGSLTTRYLARTPLERPLVLGSRILSQDGRKIATEAWVEVDGERTVEATALFIEVALTERAGDPA